MQVIYERCCGLDVHKKTVVACLITPDATGKPHKVIRTFGTMTQDLLQLLDWLTIHECTHVAMSRQGCIGARSTICWKVSSRSWL